MPKSPFNTFLIQLLVFSLAMAVLLYFLNKNISETFHSAYMWHIFILFVIVTAWVHYMLIQANKKSPQHFMRAFMATSFIKMFAGLSVILVYGLLNKAGAVGFALNFLVIYLPFLVFEVACLIKYFQKKT